MDSPFSEWEAEVEMKHRSIRLIEEIKENTTMYLMPLSNIHERQTSARETSVRRVPSESIWPQENNSENEIAPTKIKQSSGHPSKISLLKAAIPLQLKVKNNHS